MSLQALLQMVQSHDGSIKSVVEKGDTLLASVHYPPIRDKINRLKKDYAELCNSAVVRSACQLMKSVFWTSLDTVMLESSSSFLFWSTLSTRAMCRTWRCR